MNSKVVFPVKLKLITALLASLAFGLFSCQGGAAKGGEKCTRISFPPPASHKGDWVRLHGKAMNGAADQESCLVCHLQNDCNACHAQRMPVDHKGAAWRTKVHGLSAASDRDRCAACHREDYCASCHRATAPRSHGPKWISKHCAGCHLDNGAPTDEGCTVCHKRRPHSTAPHPIPTSLDCKSCHVK